MDLGIYKGITPNILMPQRLLTPAMKEVVAGVESDGACKNKTQKQVSRNGVDEITPGNMRDAVSIVETLYPVLILIVSHPHPMAST